MSGRKSGTYLDFYIRLIVLHVRFVCSVTTNKVFCNIPNVHIMYAVIVRCVVYLRIADCGVCFGHVADRIRYLCDLNFFTILWTQNFATSICLNLLYFPRYQSCLLRLCCLLYPIGLNILRCLRFSIRSLCFWYSRCLRSAVVSFFCCDVSCLSFSPRTSFLPCTNLE